MKSPKSVLRHGKTWENGSPMSQSRSPLRGDMGLGKPVPMSSSPTWDDRRRPAGGKPPAAIEITFTVGRFTCRMWFPLPDGPLSATWEPEKPGRLTGAEMAAYRDGRNALIAEVTRQTGLRIAVIEA